MTVANSIDTSVFSQLIDSLGTFPARDSLYRTVEPVQTETGKGSSGGSYQDVDLSSYYSDIENSDLLTLVGENVKQASEALENAMMSALENGMSVEDVCNLKSCMAAYKASCYVAKSTFELSV